MLTAVSLMFPYLFGLGSLLLLVCGSMKGETNRYSDSDRMQLFATILVLGVIVNHLGVLLFSDLRHSLMLGSSLSLAGFVYVLAGLRKRQFRVITPGWLAIFFTLYVACLFVVLVEPIGGWDARSIWFFHGKMIFYNASLDAGGGWANPLIGFSHPDYPKLVAILAAQVAFVAGYWNEYLPKLSLVALLVPALFCLISILREKWWHPVLIAVPLLFTNVWLKNGYMDGYLAIYAGLAAFYWARWLDDGKRLDLVSGILFTGIVLDLKNEGMLYALIVAGLLLFFVAFKKERFYACLAGKYEIMLTLFLSISATLLWHRKKQVFGLHNDLQLGLGSLERIQDRLTDGSLTRILRSLYVTENINLSLGIYLLTLVWVLGKGKRPGNGSLFCALTGCFYFAGMVLIYLATPYDLISFHLPTGNRTMLPVHIILLAAAFLLYRGVSANSTTTTGDGT